MASGNKGTFRPVLVVFMAIALLIGALLGIGLGSTLNILRNENFSEFTVALPSKLYDIKGRLITEFYAEENGIRFR